jgi:hypothetical protein
MLPRVGDVAEPEPLYESPLYTDVPVVAVTSVPTMALNPSHFNGVIAKLTLPIKRSFLSWFGSL